MKVLAFVVKACRISFAGFYYRSIWKARIPSRGGSRIETVAFAGACSKGVASIYATSASRHISLGAELLPGCGFGERRPGR